MDSTNGIKPSGVPKIWKFVLNVRNLGRSDIDKFYLIESKQHTLPTKGKFLMLQTLHAIIKWRIPHV
jgi:hypothetical protein